MNERAFSKQQQKLIDLVLSQGKTQLHIFNYQAEWRESFLRECGLWELAEQAEGKRTEAIQSFDKREQRRLDDESLVLEKEIVRRCRILLREQGVDVESVLGPERTWDEVREMLVRQFEEAGFSRQQVEQAGLLEEDLITQGADGQFYVQDSISQRRRLDDAGISYTAQDGRITLRLHARAQPGVVYDDTPQGRKFLDEEEVRYLALAQGNALHPHGRRALFVPFNWLTSVEKGYNYKLGRLVIRSSLLGAAAVLGGPCMAAALVLTMTLKNTFVPRKRDHLTWGERRALNHGLTVYKKNTDSYGREQPMYYFRDGSKLCSVSVYDVRIPDRYRGIPLTPFERKQLREGKLLKLTDREGIPIAVRIDVTQPNGLREYVRQPKQKESWQEIPGKFSSDRDKLAWIAQYGAAGITQIYGESVRHMQRDTFLSRYGIKHPYDQYCGSFRALKEVRDDQHRQRLEASMREADHTIRGTARSESEKMVRGRSR